MIGEVWHTSLKRSPSSCPKKVSYDILIKIYKVKKKFQNETYIDDSFTITSIIPCIYKKRFIFSIEFSVHDNLKCVGSSRTLLTAPLYQWNL